MCVSALEQTHKFHVFVVEYYEVMKMNKSLSHTIIKKNLTHVVMSKTRHTKKNMCYQNLLRSYKSSKKNQ